MRSIKYFVIAFLSIGLVSCTDLEEQIVDGIVPGEGNVDVQSLLDGAYERLRQFSTQDNIWALQQHSTDETMGPTRGTDWDDNGVWRVLHDHTWDDEHQFNRSSWNDMNRGLYLANNILAFNPTTEQEAEARFLRAFFVYIVNDHWGQVPMRVPGEDVATNDPTVMSSTEATNFVINELETIMADLPDGVPAYRASKMAAAALLAKVYLNKGVYTAPDRSSPSFSSDDMNKVIEYSDMIIESGNYSLAANYFDNFKPANDMLSTELIFTSQNNVGDAGNVESRWHCTMHYNQNPSGWNGFCTIGDFYDKFTDTDDVRWATDDPEYTAATGVKLGFLAGQQVNESGTPLKDRRDQDLVFSKKVALFETGDDLEITGVRVVKYAPDLDNLGDPDNDYVLFRYADILLCKAEAMARGGNPTLGQSPSGIVDEIRSARNTDPNGDGSLEAIYDERGFELYWEGHRRQDMIRFGKFTESYNEKGTSESFRVLFPIPSIELASSPNIVQNPGY